ncbi:carbon-nitrogen hydrolase family protein [Candidatus Leptofilum sp.]|uniref:carbon-nitrogen hydrolase family protein n=1 Tax=Candidatus Leptofilum sp. TaxID=3241576 RepID=UPI003B5C5244
MRICLAQIQPVTGNIAQNITCHQQFVDKAIAHRADLILFSELSLTGYEPTRAQELAIAPDDARLDVFQRQADAGNITICVGVPTQGEPLPGISLLIFQPQQPRTLYTKQFLHVDERPFFTAGQKTTALIGPQNEAALAICYEISVPEHAQAAADKGAKIYLASVAKYARGIEEAYGRLAHIAQTHRMTTFMANCVGLADGERCAGQSAVWNRKGECVAQLDDSNEGLIIFD